MASSMQPLMVPVEGPGRKSAGVFIHIPCRNVELWNEMDQGPINDQGCDACESAPDGNWRRVWVEIGEMP